MCANVAYEYCNMYWGMRYGGNSAPPEVAFVLAIPYTVGIVLSLNLSYIFKKKYKK